jgi:hypothetical protein
MARVTDSKDPRHPETANWNALAYGNNGVRENAVTRSELTPNCFISGVCSNKWIHMSDYRKVKLHGISKNRMKFPRILLSLPILFGLTFSGCVSNLSNPVAEDRTNIDTIIGPDYRNRGKIPFESMDDKFTSTTGCEVAYTYFRPRDVLNDVLVVLGHGFLRSKKRMAYLAQHLASWGVSVVNLELCNSKLWDGNHDLNGADMVAVSQKLYADKVIYMGFSAGGLAAMVAANLDKNTRALFGLDMVDHLELGKKIAPDLVVPFFGLIAAPSACNANNNGLVLYALAPHSNVIKVEDTSHCHFEFPVDGKCSFVCGKGENRFSRQTIQQTIVGLTTAFLLWQTGIDANGETWWFDSQPNYKAFRGAGYITRPLNDGS